MTRPHRRKEGARFRTSREVYDRVLWDPRFDPRHFTVVYQDRELGDLEVPLAGFVPDGDIPWHRVQAFRQHGATVWDRRARVDRIFGPADASLVPAPARWRDDPFFSPRPAWRFDAAGDRWSVALTPPAEAPASLRLVTCHVPSERRDEALVDALAALDADVVVLQSVTPALLDRLAADERVRARYVLSDAPPGETLGAHGQLVLSRVPIAGVGLHEFAPDERVVLVELGRTGRLAVAAVHLPGGHGRDAEAQRATRFAALCAHLRAEDIVACVIAGDLGARDGEPWGAAEGFVDAWQSARPEPATRTGEPERPDRVLVRDPSGVFLPTGASLVGAEGLGEPGLRGLGVTLGTGIQLSG